MATLAESFLADLEDLSDVEDEEPQQAGAAGGGEDDDAEVGRRRWRPRCRGLVD